MTSTPVALVLLTAQRHHLEDHPQERALLAAWQRQVQAARAAGYLVVHVQWDGAEGTPGATFSRGWVLHPDFRAEEGDLPLRATHPDAFAGSGLDAKLRRRGVTEIHFLTLPETEMLPATAETARGLGYGVQVLEAQPQTLSVPG